MPWDDWQSERVRGEANDLWPSSRALEGREWAAWRDALEQHFPERVIAALGALKAESTRTSRPALGEVTARLGRRPSSSADSEATRCPWCLGRAYARVVFYRVPCGEEVDIPQARESPTRRSLLAPLEYAPRCDPLEVRARCGHCRPALGVVTCRELVTSWEGYWEAASESDREVVERCAATEAPAPPETFPSSACSPAAEDSAGELARELTDTFSFPGR